MNQLDLMVDLETLATEPDAVVLSIGATAFSIEDGIAPVQFYAVLRTDQQKGRIIDADTVRWWIGQTQDNPGAADVFAGGSENVHGALYRLCEYVTNWCAPESEIWANDPSFDCVILRSLFDEHDIELPWRYWRERSFRTIKSIGRGIKIEDKDLDVGMNMQMHNALADAIWQARYVIAMKNEMGIAA